MPTQVTPTLRRLLDDCNHGHVWKMQNVSRKINLKIKPHNYQPSTSVSFESGLGAQKANGTYVSE